MNTSDKNMNTLLCSVLMSTYNGEKYVCEQIDSILCQEEIDVNLYIRDDGSRDNTKNILKQYSEKYNNIHVIEGENLGIHKSFAELMKIPDLKGYIAFSDQDDVWDKDKLSSAIHKLIDFNAEFYSSASRLVDSNLFDLMKTTANSKEYSHYINGNNKILTPGVQGCTIVISNSLFKKLTCRPYPDYYGHDTWITIVAFYLYNCYYDICPHMSYRQHDASWTGNRNNRFAQLKREYHFFMEGMNRYAKIAKDLLLYYSDDLKVSDQRFLMILAKPNKTIKEKLQLIFCKDFNKFGLLKNVIFKLEIIKGNV